MSACPYNEITPEVMTNCDHSIDSDVAKRLKTQDAFSRYAGWNFNGRVWWDKSRAIWCCEVWVYGSPDGTVEAPTLPELMAKVCDRWGSD